MNQKILSVLICLFCLSMLYAQAFDPQAKIDEARMIVAAVRAARVDAMRQLGEAIQGVAVTSRTTVKDFVTENDEITAQFSSMLQGAHEEGKPKIYKDGTVEIKLVLYLDDVANGLANVGNMSASELAKFRNNSARKFEATGYGAMASNPSEDLGNVDLWKYVKPQGRLMARRAAQVDAQRNMGETMYGIKIDSQTEVRDFIAQSDRIRASFDGIVRGVQFESKVVYRPDGLAEVTAFIKVDALVRQLAAIAQAQYNGNDYHYQASNFSNIRKYFPNDIVYATGVGAPPAKFITNYANNQGSSDPLPYEPTNTNPPVIPVNPGDYNNTGNNSNINNNDINNGNNGNNGYIENDKPYVNPVNPENDINIVTPNVPVAPVAPEFPEPPTPPEYDFGGPRKPALPEMPRIPERFVPEWAKKDIYGTGTGVYPENMDIGQARAMARRAAQVDAYRVLGEEALGVKLMGETTVENFAAVDDIIRARLDECFLRGATTYNENEREADGIFEVTMKLYLGDMWEIIDARYNKEILEKAGKSMADYNPADTYQAEFDAYMASLNAKYATAKNYNQQLENYHTQYANELSMDFPISRENQAKYEKYLAEVERYIGIYDNYRAQMEEYQRNYDAYKAQFDQYQAEYKRLHGLYSTEAEAALMVGPVAPPTLDISIPDPFGVPGAPKVPERFVPEWADKDITATGNGAYRMDLDIAQARAMAKRAAQVDAYRLLAENAMGVHLDSQTDVKNFLTERDELKARVNDVFVRGAQEVATRENDAKHYIEVDMKLYLGYMWEIIDAEYNKVLIEKYGKELAEFQPDQKRYNNELEYYKANLATFKQQYTKYIKDLQDYQVTNRVKLAVDHSVPKKYAALVSQYKARATELAKQYNATVKKYNDYKKYRAEQEANFAKQKAEYEKLYAQYDGEAKAALVPAPPAMPEIYFSVPSLDGKLTLPKPPERFIPQWAKQTIQATGTGVYPKDKTNVGQAMALARRAAQLDAYRLLAESAVGVHIQGETTVSEFLTQRDAMKARVNDVFVRGAQEVDAKDYSEKRTYQVRMKLYLGDMWEIIDAEYNKVLVEEYNKKLEDYQPDQLRYKTEYEMYVKQLDSYKEGYEKYQQQLQRYYEQYGDTLSMNYPVTNRYKEELTKSKEATIVKQDQYNSFQAQLNQYRQALLQNQKNYQKYQQDTQRLMQQYTDEAEAALVPNPPEPPAIAYEAPVVSEDGIPEPPRRYVPEWAKRTITVTGTGSYPTGKSQAQAKLLAKRAAQVDAYRLLAESAMGVRLQSNTTVENFLTTNDKISTKVDAMIKGQQEVAYRDDPTRRFAQVDMKLYLGDMWELIDAAYNKVLIEKYGKELAEYQPDQLRYKTELELYRSRLQGYKNTQSAYQHELDAYYNQYKNILGKNYSVCEKLRNNYQECRNQLNAYKKQDAQYQQSINQYQANEEKKIREYDNYNEQFKKLYNQYLDEALEIENN